MSNTNNNMQTQTSSALHNAIIEAGGKDRPPMLAPGVLLAKVMSTPAYVDSESITQADGAQSSRVPVLLPDDPYVAVRQTQLVDTESEPEEAPSEIEELQSLGSRVPLMGEEFETVEPSGTRTDSSHSSALSDSTIPLSPDHPLTHVSPTPIPTHASFHHRTLRMTVRVQPAMSPGHSARVTEAMALSDSPFRESEEDELGDEEDESSDADDERERESQSLGDEDHGLDDESQGLEDEGLGLEGEEVVPKDPEDGRVYTDIPAYVPLSAPVQTQPSLEWSLGSLPVSPSSLVVPSPIASPVATPTATISVYEDQFIEVKAQLELHGSILQDHTQRLDALPPTLIVDIDRDVRELYTRLGVVRSRFSRRDMSWARYDKNRLIHDMLVQQAVMQRKLQEMRGRVTALEQERD
ncbi:hypothetical protein Tco_0666342, partial [Tanacetum coccineum]